MSNSKEDKLLSANSLCYTLLMTLNSVRVGKGILCILWNSILPETTVAEVIQEGTLEIPVPVSGLSFSSGLPGDFEFSPAEL